MDHLDTRRFRPKPGFILEQVDDELLIYHPSEALIVYCNPTAALVWQLCDGARTAGQIATLLADAYPDQHATVAQDVHDALAQLCTQEAVEAVEGPDDAMLSGASGQDTQADAAERTDLAGDASRRHASGVAAP